EGEQWGRRQPSFGHATVVRWATRRIASVSSLVVQRCVSPAGLQLQAFEWPFCPARTAAGAGWRADGTPHTPRTNRQRTAAVTGSGQESGQGTRHSTNTTDNR